LASCRSRRRIDRTATPKACGFGRVRLARQDRWARGHTLLWIAHFYPTSTYAASLSAEVRERAAHRLFQPPKTGASVICPHCGAPHAAPPGMDELIQFFVLCGNSVEVKPPRVQ
jgi:hypothetical protein